MSVNGNTSRSRTIVGGTLALIGVLAALSQFFDLLNVLPRGPETVREAILTKYMTSTAVVYGAHFVLLAVAGCLIVRGSKRSVWFLWFSVFAWITGVSVTAWAAKSVAAEEGLEQIQPVRTILNVAISRFVMVLPSIIGLVFARARLPKEGTSTD